MQWGHFWWFRRSSWPGKPATEARAIWQGGVLWCHLHVNSDFRLLLARPTGTDSLGVLDKKQTINTCLLKRYPPASLACHHHSKKKIADLTHQTMQRPHSCRLTINSTNNYHVLFQKRYRLALWRAASILTKTTHRKLIRVVPEFWF